jgi:hypothetical protein
MNQETIVAEMLALKESLGRKILSEALDKQLSIILDTLLTDISPEIADKNYSKVNQIQLQAKMINYIKSMPDQLIDENYREDNINLD